MRHVPSGHMLPRRLTMFLLVVKENIRTECFQEFAFIHAAKKQRFINADVPRSQCTDDTLVSGCSSRGDERGADRRGICRVVQLNLMKHGEEILERPTGQRLFGCKRFIFLKSIQSFVLVDTL